MGCSLSFPDVSEGEESDSNAGDLGFDPLQKGMAVHSSILT